MTDHQKAVCWDTLRQQLELDVIPITGAAVLKSMKDMEKAMATPTPLSSPPSRQKLLTANRDIRDKVACLFPSITLPYNEERSNSWQTHREKDYQQIANSNLL